MTKLNWNKVRRVKRYTNPKIKSTKPPACLSIKANQNTYMNKEKLKLLGFKYSGLYKNWTLVTHDKSKWVKAKQFIDSIV